MPGAFAECGEHVLGALARALNIHIVEGDAGAGEAFARDVAEVVQERERAFAGNFDIDGGDGDFAMADERAGGLRLRLLAAALPGGSARRSMLPCRWGA